MFAGPSFYILCHVLAIKHLPLQTFILSWKIAIILSDWIIFIYTFA